MMEDQTKQPEAAQSRESAYSTRSQERQARWMAKQAARDVRSANRDVRSANRDVRSANREAHRAARAQRLHRDWTFEVKIGEKEYCFNWRWHPAESSTVEDTQVPAPETETEAVTE